jgi:hypothetical protein
MDLDCVVGGPLDPLFNRPEDLVLYKGTAPNRPYNGSLQLITAGCRPKVFEDFTAEGARISGEEFTGSDQAWLAHKLGPREKVWSEKDGVFWWGPLYRGMAKKVKPRLLFFPGKIKPWDIARIRLDPFTTNNYRIGEREAA